MGELWLLRLTVALVLSAAFSVAVFLALPKALKHYVLWAETREEKHLKACFSDGGVALFLLLAIFAVLLKKISCWWGNYGS